MANTFTRKGSRSVGTAAVQIGGYSPAPGATATVIGLSVANVTGTPIAVDLYVNDGTNNFYLVKGAPIPVGGTLVAVGGDQKLVLGAGDKLFVVSTVVGSADVLLSILEVS